VIVTYNSEDVIHSCLDALNRHAPETPVTIVDNASTDRTPEAVRRRAGVEVLAQATNRGFAGAVNLGFRATREECVLLLNPDVRLAAPLARLAEACTIHGLAAGVLTDQSGRPQRGFTIRRLPTPAALAFELLGVNRVWPFNPVNRRYRYLDRDLSQAGPVEQPAGAFLMVRRDVWERLGGFDERFHPVWFEDADFCGRALRQGFRIELVPSVRAVHLGGHSVRRLPPGSRARFWYASLLEYAAGQFSPMEYRAVCLAALCSAVPRMIAGILKERSFSPVTTWIEILSSAGRRLVSPENAANRPG
jgi:GT2 family glycosyltransferase